VTFVQVALDVPLGICFDYRARRRDPGRHRAARRRPVRARLPGRRDHRGVRRGVRRGGPDPRRAPDRAPPAAHPGRDPRPRRLLQPLLPPPARRGPAQRVADGAAPDRRDGARARPCMAADRHWRGARSVVDPGAGDHPAGALRASPFRRPGSSGRRHGDRTLGLARPAGLRALRMGRGDLGAGRRHAAGACSSSKPALTQAHRRASRGRRGDHGIDGRLRADPARRESRAAARQRSTSRRSQRSSPAAGRRSCSCRRST
jgi:hypothetical protein